MLESLVGLIVPATRHRIDLGLRLDRERPRGRLHPSKIHETMRLQISLGSPEDVDGEVLSRLQQAYEENC